MDPLSVMRQIGGGYVLQELAEKLAQTGAAVLSTGQAGSVTLKLAIKPLKEGGGIAVIIEESITQSMPKKPARGAVMFVHDGELHRVDPRQEPLPEFRVVAQTDGSVQHVDQTSGEIRRVAE
jgi:hypothetical protein